MVSKRVTMQDTSLEIDLAPELDNLVSQAKQVNLSEYKIIENEWAKALENGKKVTVDIGINYSG